MKLGLLGEKLTHSYSPEIHRLAFEILGIKGSYYLFEREIDNIPLLVEKLRKEEINGFNITIPYKEEIIKYTDEVSDKVKKIGACNTLLKKNGKIIGENTDYFGFRETIERLACNMENKKAVVLGSGGSAKAVIEVLLHLGAEKIYLVSRNKKNIKFSKNKTEWINYEDLEGIKEAQLVVNTTPLGMYPKIGFSALEKSLMLNYNYAIDLIYNPKETEFLKYARESGLKYDNGLYMLVAQGLRANELWTGKKFSNDEIEEIYYKIKKIVYEKRKIKGD